MGDIVLLDDLTINKIAAGEVIERPASVVKEMVENSIDAGATKIIVEIKNGGISYIRVTDNGKGISEDDMEIAFERHATSKIRVADDILKVTSMGFRGEALASIAAIANVEMVSKTSNSNIGHRIVVEGGKVLEKTETGAPQGTTITVKNLFYNTPVRYKFLKKDYTESGYIEDVITRLALVNRDVSFKLVNSGKTVIQTTGNGQMKDVIYNIYGKDIAEAIIDTDYEYEGMKVTGAVGKPEIARSNRSNQLYFVNNRYIKDRTLTAAAEQAFKGMIPINKFGFLILNIDMDPSLVDVNVHPAKLEVRFEDENKVFKAVYHAIKEALAKKELVEDVSQVKDEDVKKNNTNVENVQVPGATVKINTSLDNASEEVRKNQERNAFLEQIRSQAEKDESNQQDESVQQDMPSFLKKNESGTEKVEEHEEVSDDVYQFRKDLEKIGVHEISPAAYVPEVLNDMESKDKKEETGIPSEEKVEAMTEELIKQRQSNEILEEAIKNAKKENPFLNNSEDKETNFDDMYAKIFGNKATHESEEPQFTETEKKVLEDIKNSVKVQEDEETTENKITENNEISLDFDDDQENATPVLEKDVQPVITQENSEQIEEFRNMTGKNYKFIGIVFSTYIIVEIEDEMYIIDQHAAHERIRYEQVKQNYYSETNKDSQLMLLPDIITLSHKETETIKENVDMFEKAGFSLEAFGENTIKLTGVPTICIDMDTKQLFLELLDEIDNFSRTDRQEKEDRFIATIACKSAVKAKMRLTEEEVDKLMEELLKLPNPFTCPHGRPTAIRMGKYEIERKFARK